MTDEEYVRANWEYVWLYEGKRKFELNTSAGTFDGPAKEGAAPLFLKAREFTKSRKEEIRQVKEEIALQEAFMFFDNIEAFIVGSGHPEFSDKDADSVRILTIDHVRSTRTLSRLQSILSDLQRGMKGTEQ